MDCYYYSLFCNDQLVHKYCYHHNKSCNHLPNPCYTTCNHCKCDYIKDFNNKMYNKYRDSHKKYNQLQKMFDYRC